MATHCVATDVPVVIWTVFFSIGVKMSSNSLLASLNQRQKENSDEVVEPASGSSMSPNTLVTQEVNNAVSPESLPMALSEAS